MRYYCDFGWRRWTRFVPPDGWIAIESDCHLTAPSEAEGTGVARRRAATDGGISDVARFFYTVSLFCFLWLSRFRLRSSSFFFGYSVKRRICAGGIGGPVIRHPASRRHRLHFASWIAALPKPGRIFFLPSCRGRGRRWRRFIPSFRVLFAVAFCGRAAIVC